MKLISNLFAIFMVATMTAQQTPKPELIAAKPATDTYHGVKVVDDYRNLENMDDPEVINWMKENSNYAKSVLNKIPGKEKLMQMMLDLDSRQSNIVSNLKITEDDDYFYLMRKPEDETGKLYRRSEYNGDEKLFFDPEKYKADSENNYTITDFMPNEDGDMIAVMLSPNGSETGEVIFVDNDGNIQEETLELAQFNMSWLSEDELMYPKIGSADISDQTRQMNLKNYVHKLGTSQEEDKVIFSAEMHPELNISPVELPIVIYDDITENLFTAVLTVDKAWRLFKAENNKFPTTWTEIIKKEDMIGGQPAITKNAMYYLSFKDAPNFKILKADLDNPSVKNAEVVVPEPEIGPITGMYANDKGLFYTLQQNGVKSRLFFLEDGSEEPREIKLPFTAGSISLSGKMSDSDDLWVNISGWNQSNKRYRYNMDDDEFISEPMSSEVEYPELENLVVEEIEVTSHDGVKVPVSIIRRDDVKMDNSTPTVIYGYGSYGNSTGPFFSPIILSFTEFGGILVVPHVRGGGELGDAWHRAGQKENKPNTWKDAIATAEYLIDEGYTSPDKLSIFGGSAGGIFVGRSITERPDLFAAAAPLVGAMNNVRMEETPNGPVNAPEFGTIKDKKEFEALLEMDSYHALEKGEEYPAMFITAGMNDPRVIAWQPAKFAAKAQAYNASDEPILFLTDFESGHGIGDDKTKRMENFADVFSFFYWQSGHPEFQPNQELKN